MFHNFGGTICGCCYGLMLKGGGANINFHMSHEEKVCCAYVYRIGLNLYFYHIVFVYYICICRCLSRPFVVDASYIYDICYI